MNAIGNIDLQFKLSKNLTRIQIIFQGIFVVRAKPRFDSIGKDRMLKVFTPQI
jgi:hypothetical protein